MMRKIDDLSEEELDELNKQLMDCLDESFDLVQPESTFVNSLGHFLFGVIVFAIFFVIFIVSKGISDLQVDGLSVLILNVIANAITVLGGFLSIKLYEIFINVIFTFRRISKYKNDAVLDRDSRLWTFLVVFFGYSIFGLEDKRIEWITTMSVSLIFGRFFWIDNTKVQFEEIRNSFAKIPMPIKMVYAFVIIMIMKSYLHWNGWIVGCVFLLIVAGYIVYMLKEALRIWAAKVM